jgi:hypothetical protein
MKMHADYFNALLVFLGFLMHFLTRWGEFWRTVDKLGPWEYAKQDPPAWVFGIVGVVVSYLTLPQLGPYVGVEPPLGAVIAGYFASSLAAKVPGFMGKGGTR